MTIQPLMMPNRSMNIVTYIQYVSAKHSSK